MTWIDWVGVAYLSGIVIAFLNGVVAEVRCAALRRVHPDRTPIDDMRTTADAMLWLLIAALWPAAPVIGAVWLAWRGAVSLLARRLRRHLTTGGPA